MTMYRSTYYTFCTHAFQLFSKRDLIPIYLHQQWWLYLLTPWCRVLLEKLTGFAASQEIPHILWNPKVHYRTHKPPPPVSILGQPNPVHIPTSHLLQICPNIIHPSTSRSPQRSPSLQFPHQDPIHPPLLTHMRHMPSPVQWYNTYN